MLRRAVAASSVLWASAIPLAAIAAARPHGGARAYGFALAVYAAGSAVCHQLPARSFSLWSTPLPVCARCTGIYMAAAVAALVAYTGKRSVAGARKAGGSPLVALALASAPTALTLLYEWTTGVTPANWLRAAAGAPLGAMAAWIVIN